MLRQASVSDLIRDRVSVDTGYIVITMRRYPRFISRQLRNEYLSCMSPEPKLFEDWLSAKRRHQDHDGAFARARFEQRFAVGEEGLMHLARLSERARAQDVYLVCQCPTGERCHREFLLILAKELFGAPAERPRNAYPVFRRRVAALRRKLSAAARSPSAARAEPAPAPRPRPSRPESRS